MTRGGRCHENFTATVMSKSGTVRGKPVICVTSSRSIIFRTSRPSSGRLFSEHFFASRNIAATHVLTRTNAWFQYPDFDIVLAAVREKTRSATRILAYGSSMGGYGAVRFSDAVGASQVIALSPQYSIDRQVMPNERRWLSHSRRTRFIAARNGPITCSANVLIFYDPHGPDRDHALRIAQDIPVRMLAVPYGGHPVGSFLSEAGLLTQLLVDMLDGGVDLSGLEQACRLARRHSANYCRHWPKRSQSSEQRWRCGLRRRRSSCNLTIRQHGISSR